MNTQFALTDLPVELIQLIAAKSVTTDELLNLMQTSKLLANNVTRCLRNPITLLQIMNKMTPSELVRLVGYFFSPESGNYQAIASAHASAHAKGSPMGLICFAFITNDIKRLDWNAVIHAIDDMSEKHPDEYEKLKKALQIMRSIAEAKTPQESAGILKSERDNTMPGIVFGHTYTGQSIYERACKIAGKGLTLPLKLDILDRTLCYLNLSGVHFNNLSFDAVALTMINFRNASFEGVQFNCIDLSRTILDGINLKGAALGPFGGIHGSTVSFIPFGESLNKELLKSRLDEFAKFKAANPESDQIIKKDILKTIITNIEANLGSRFNNEHLEIARMAYEHPFFSHHRDLGSVREFFNNTARALGIFGSASQNNLIETDSQKMLFELIQKFNQSIAKPRK